MKRYKNTPYFVTQNGEVFREGSNTPLKPDTSSEYLRVTLSIDGKTERHSIHRMVAETYLPNWLNKPQVNHKDLNKLNNHVSNLEWATIQENTIHAYNNCLSWGNVKASNQASINRYKDTYSKFKNLLGNLFIGLVHKNTEHQIEYHCPNCYESTVVRSDSTRFKQPLSLLCKPCKKVFKTVN